MTTFRDWSVTASANTGNSTDGWMKENINYSEVNNAYREGQAIQARWLADNNGSIVSVAGASSSYSLATNATLSSLQDGDMVRFVAHANNSGASTVAVGETSARPMVAIDGVDLVADAIVAGGTYDLSYRSASAKWQVVNLPPSDLKLNSPTVGTLAVTDTTAIDLSDTDNALNVGTLAGGHIAVDPDSIQAKDSATTPGDLNINALGGNTIIGSQTASGSGSVDLYHAGIKRVGTNAAGAATYGNGLILDNSGADQNTQIRAVNQIGGFGHYVMVTDGEYRLYQTDAAGAIEDIWITGARNGAVGLRYDNSERIVTTANGMSLDAGTASALLVVTGADAAGEGGQINIEGAGSDTYVALDNASGGIVRLLVKDGAEVAFQATPDGAAVVYHDNSAKLTTTTGGVSVTGDVSASSAAVNTLTLAGNNVPTVADFASGYQANASTGDVGPIAFGKTFSSAPIVMITPVNDGAASGNPNSPIVVQSVSTTGFNAYVAGDIPEAFRNINWIAVTSGV